jgi:SAM-dependent methyltransferase
MNTDTYWLECGKGYLKEFEYHGPIRRICRWRQERALRDILSSLGDIETVLEIGCGFGRITNILVKIPGVKSVVATDISPDQIANAKKLVRDPRVEFRLISATELDYDQEFDLVVASEVLMHIPPDRVERVLENMHRAGKHVMHIDWYAPNEPHEAGGFCWQHNYREQIVKQLHRQAIFYE